MAQLDLNLLYALDVLLAEGSVTAAAERLHLSVPATSRTLDRIRKAVGDPILVRAGRGLVPTPRATAMQPRLRQLLEEAQALMEIGRELDVASLERTFTLRANDALIGPLASALMERIHTAAPGVRVRFLAEGQEDISPLRDATIDLEIGVINHLSTEIRTEPLYEDRLLGVVSATHPLAGSEITLPLFVSMPHVAVSRRGVARGALDAKLEEHGLTRTVALVVPTYTSAAEVVLTSDLIGLLPERTARRLEAANGAHVFDVGLDLPTLSISQAWHLRHDQDIAHQWLRHQLHHAANPPQHSTGLPRGPRALEV
ncbi:LysR family transcriptional regulator [Nocardia sp. CA-084685]|uniref:LysR family transcriptional regulator n=1 Tax=Nocardia sp. CA-084685 TaxID=3239970 RepID=UPI003D961BC0